MQMKMSINFSKRTRQIMIMVMIVAGLVMGGVMTATAAPQEVALPASTCTLTSPGNRTCDLWATTGTLFLPDGSSVPIWGYSDTASGSAQLPGPMIIVNQGETVTINLTNNLPEATSMYFPGIAMPPDLLGAAAGGGTTSYTFVANEPGTYRYEAGLLPNAQHQVAMGLYGALIVRPDPAFASVNGTFDADYANTILADGPVHYYRLGESTGPTAFDLGTLVNDGTYGSAVALPVPGLHANSADTAAGFDGTANSYVDTGVTSLSGGAFSVEAWANADTIGTAQHRIVAKDEVGVTGAWILWFNQGALRFQVRDSSNTNWVIAEAPTTPPAGTSFHVVGVFDGTDAILYLDGVEVARTALGTATANINTLPITIGADADPINPRDHIFDGTIDEVALYDYALSPARIQAHFAVANALPSYDTAVNADGPIHYYRLGEATGPTAFDQGTLVNDGTYGSAVSLPTTGLLANNADTAAGFDGTANSFVDTGVTSLSGGPFSVEAWANANTIGTTGHRIVVKDEVGVTGAWLLWFNAGKLRFQVRNSTNTTWVIAEAPTTPPAGTTFHAVGVFDGTDAILYLDGVEVARTALGSTTTNINSLPITIGADSDPINPRDHIFDGTIDEVAIYDFAIAPARIQAHFAAGNASLGTTLVDSTADFTNFDYLVGGTLYNVIDGSSCTIAALTATTLTCAAPLSGGTANTWKLGDGYMASGNFAYNSLASAYDDEAVLLLSEIDPNLNNSIDPAAFDMRNYKPTYWLINGQAYPNTQPIPTAAGNKVLLRYINAGSQYHTMSLMGLDQMLLAEDGHLLPFQRSVVAESIMIGQTRDMIVNIPTSIPDGSKLALYDANMLLHNNNAAGFGGMMTFLTTAAGPAGPDVTGPATNAVAVTPSPTDGTVNVSLTATVSDVAAGNANIQAAEYYIDDTNGTAVAMTATDGAFDSPAEAVEATIPAATVAALSPGDHTIYVRGQDALGNWGSFNLVILRLELAGSGPTTKSLTLMPNPSAGDVIVSLSGTADDRATGNNNIADAEFFIGAPGADGNGTHMAINVLGPIASIDYDLTVADLSGYGEGVQTVYVHSQDSFGFWGDMATIDLEIDLTGPNTTAVVIAPNPNNGSLPINPSMFAARLDATISDPISVGVQSNIYQAEFFINATCDDGTGIPMYARDGVFDNPTEEAYALISLVNINALGPGSHDILVHGRDNSGNWGPCTTESLIIEQGMPTVSGTAVTPNPTNGATAVTLTAVANSAGTAAINLAEWFVDTDPGPGNGTAMTISGVANPWNLSANIDITGWVDGNYTLYTRVRDAAGNWSTTDNVVLTVTPATSYSVSLSPATDAQSGLPGATVSYLLDVTNTGNASDTFDIVVSGNAWTTTSPATVGPLAAGTTAQISVDVTIPGTAVSGDSDTATVTVTSQGDPGQSAASTLTTTATTVTDLLYFATRGNTAVPTVGGTADNADIYSWDGTAFSRLLDAAGAGSLGLPGGANVDGFVWVDATHFYMSFRSGNTNVPGLGNVQDEDVIFYNNGVWSVYFDGTAQGLTAQAQDLDGISIVGGILYFSTSGNSNPTGVTGPADNADIYSWDGASFARVWDATANGVPGGANVDGLEVVDATHFYLSFAGNTNITGFQTVQDEDVVYYNNGGWSVYFDGTAQGLTAGGQDLDAIDIP